MLFAAPDGPMTGHSTWHPILAVAAVMAAAASGCSDQSPARGDVATAISSDSPATSAPTELSLATTGAMTTGPGAAAEVQLYAVPADRLDALPVRVHRERPAVERLPTSVAVPLPDALSSDRVFHLVVRVDVNGDGALCGDDDLFGVSDWFASSDGQPPRRVRVDLDRLSSTLPCTAL